MTIMGSKGGAGVYQNIVALMPPHDFYMEPFAGSARVFQEKMPAADSLLIERDYETYLKLYGGVYLERFDRQSVSLEHDDAFRWLESLVNAPSQLARAGRTLIYADPPYVLATRTSDKRYREEFTDADHVRLAEVLNKLDELGVAVIVSGYPSVLYDGAFSGVGLGLYPGWNTREFQAMTRGGVRTEKLWFNFEPGSPHWATFAGRDKTQRQMIKRKAARWAAKYHKLPPAERLAVLAALMAEPPEG